MDYMDYKGFKDYKGYKGYKDFMDCKKRYSLKSKEYTCFSRTPIGKSSAGSLRCRGGKGILFTFD